MIVDLAVRLPASPTTIWDHITRTKTFTHVSWPMMVFVSREPGGFPETWIDGAPHRVWMFAFAFLPFGPQTVNVSLLPPDGETRRARDAGAGLISRVWDHELTVTPDGDGALYRDRVRIEAGLLTPFVWSFAALFFRWRQARWRRLVRRGFRY